MPLLSCAVLLYRVTHVTQTSPYLAVIRQSHESGAWQVHICSVTAVHSSQCMATIACMRANCDVRDLANSRGLKQSLSSKHTINLHPYQHSMPEHTALHQAMPMGMLMQAAAFIADDRARSPHATHGVQPDASFHPTADPIKPIRLTGRWSEEISSLIMSSLAHATMCN
jgi:hypothetical protein